ncbi:hypothetical protein QZH41_001598 [Actinostola sp. cb2023]|nr:hypothetical protein QZH41_001598 [Actinostola sp. cb2023]
MRSQARQNPIAFMADIEAMFHQVRIPENQYDFLRFLWWPDAVAVFLRVRKILRERTQKRIKVATNASEETKLQTATDNRSSQLTVQDLQEAELAIVQYVQSQAYGREIRVLDRINEVEELHDRTKRKMIKTQIKKTSSIYCLDPYLDQGTLRVGGRLSRANLPPHSVHPIILPRENHVTALIINEAHKTLGHTGRGHVLSRLRERYWIISANAAVRHVLSKCVICRRSRGKPNQQKMADLPKEQVTPAPPFTFTGVDYFGSYIIKTGRKEVKRYGALFTCLASRAVHIEIANSLETDSFIQALRRENIGYCVQLTACEARKTFKDIIEELKAELGEAIYANGDISNPKQRTLEMYHARIDEQNKEEILSSFSQEDGCIRVLIATIAYGMGIDCKGVKTVIHYGPPRNLEAYLQESGRAGRSSETGCKAIILYSNVMLQHCDSDIVDYVRNDDLCRRKLLLTHFDFKLCELKQYENPHECCDICQKQCHCAGDKCDYVYFNAVGSLQQDTDASRKERSITDEQKTKLTSKLEYLKKSLNNSYTERASNTDLPLFTPVNLLSGFGDSQIVQVVDNARKLFTLKCIYRYVDIWNDDVAVEILFALSSVFAADIDFHFEENETEDTDPLPDTGLWDFNDDDDDDYELLAISEFLIAEDMHGSCDYVDDSSL